MTTPKLTAGQTLPAIDVPLLSGGRRSLSQPTGGHDWQLVVVYRGKHCPICTRYLGELNKVLPELNALGIDVMAVSADSLDRATAQMDEVKPNFDIGYDLSVDQMKALGLYISGPRNGMDVERPFAEPALFVLNDEGALQIIDISNVPFCRPELGGVLRGLSFLRGLPERFPVNGSYA